MLTEALWEYRDILTKDGDQLRNALRLIGRASDFSVAQAFTLSAAVHALKPQVIIDIGTGCGNSAATFALAAKHYDSHIFTFDLGPHWNTLVLPRLNAAGTHPWSNVRPLVGDITLYDFTPMAALGERILVFWDAHGYAIAEHILGHLLPLIADKEHVVICHDITDNRFLTDKSGNEDWKNYNGKRLWRGMEDFDANANDTNYINFGWSQSIIDQIIPILDFCIRNNMQLISCDHEFRIDIGSQSAQETIQTLPELSELISMAYFTMNGTSARRFPRMSQAFADGLAARNRAAASQAA